jgi:diacylglycerol kinase family enzyme
MNRPILLIANPAAAVGRAARGWERLLVHLETRRLQVDSVMTDGPGHAISLAREANGRYDVIAAVGGDGDRQ